MQKPCHPFTFSTARVCGPREPQKIEQCYTHPFSQTHKQAYIQPKSLPTRPQPTPRDPAAPLSVTGVKIMTPSDMEALVRVIRRYLAAGSRCSKERCGSVGNNVKPCDWVSAVLDGPEFGFQAGRSGRTVATMPCGLVDLLNGVIGPGAPLDVIADMGLAHMPKSHMLSGRVQAAVKLVRRTLIDALLGLGPANLELDIWDEIMAGTDRDAYQKLWSALHAVLDDLCLKDRASHEFLSVLGFTARTKNA